MKKTKASLVEDIERDFSKARRAVPRKVIVAVVESFIDAMKDSLIEGSPIELRGFGSFELRTRKIKQNARNPKTGESVYVPSHNVVAFKSGKELRNAVWDIDAEEKQTP